MRKESDLNLIQCRSIPLERMFEKPTMFSFYKENMLLSYSVRFTLKCHCCILFYFIKKKSITCTCCLLLSKYKTAHEVLHGEQTVRLMDKLVPLQWEPIGPWMEPVLRLQTPAAGWVLVLVTCQ